MNKKRIINNKKIYDKHLKSIKLKAGDRYHPELNIDLPISKIFDALTRNKAFYRDLREKRLKIKNSIEIILRREKYFNSDLRKNFMQKT
ncbi:hypothetical protein Dip510_001452 [Elusimicrobium posterum]|uniref:hypothetical protein n=1 Tax=Elusimicrobium posterum TaxID=3116653 RepID=UPI003C712940